MESAEYYQKNNKALTYFLLCLLFLIIAFIFVSRLKNNSIDSAGNIESIFQNETEEIEDGNIIKLEIAPTKVPCLANYLDGCFVANNNLFEFFIKGFNFKEGIVYSIEVIEKQKNGTRAYYLKDVLSEREATEEEIQITLEVFGSFSEIERLGLSLPKPEKDSVYNLDLNNQVSAVSVLGDQIENNNDTSTINEDRVIAEDIININVASDYVDCGEGGFKCLVVDGDVFYGFIEKFDYVVGYEYILRVKRKVLSTTSLTVGNYKYELLEIVSQNKV